MAAANYLTIEDLNNWNSEKNNKKTPESKS